MSPPDEMEVSCQPVDGKLREPPNMPNSESPNHSIDDGDLPLSALKAEKTVRPTKREDDGQKR